MVIYYFLESIVVDVFIYFKSLRHRLGSELSVSGQDDHLMICDLAEARGLREEVRPPRLL